MEYLITIGGSLLVQTGFCLIPKRWLRPLPILLSLLTCGIMFLLAVTFEGWAALAYIAVALYALICAGVTLVVYLIGEVVRAVIHKKKHAE